SPPECNYPTRPTPACRPYDRAPARSVIYKGGSHQASATDRIYAGRWPVSGAYAGGVLVRAGRVALSGHGGVSVRRQRGHEAEKLQGELVRVAVIGAELGGDVRDPVQVKDAGHGVADGGHGPVRAAGAAGILPEYDVTDIMMDLNCPVAAEIGEQVSGAGLVRRKAGDAEDGDRSEQFPVRVVAVALDEEHLPHAGEQFPDLRRGRQRLDRADVGAPVAPVHGPGLSCY